eukprot:CAMPEP_0204829282 /NCGR_PEP_ID=MMETSP1346-20131115/7395_1 /ASSEMBLY_ACC=CAM_ASM_000771 /TAXON_ID=215587 /ORGANISM="Aplanochytrium stocchinoi, Strain GSBS06" /LENGTH=54 /DNA_ID=CAMNT_0051958949 /DNA_START=43 /DNA_END=204 /DNA_ORIENTATION=-
MASEAEKARKVAELQLYCITNGIEFSKSSSRLELLKLVKEWKKKRQIRINNGEI